MSREQTFRQNSVRRRRSERFDLFAQSLGADLIGVSDLVLDDKAYTSWGLLIFREEFLTVDRSLNSAERMQSTVKVFAEHILQIVRKADDHFLFGMFVFSMFSGY